jgi:hypothetical protein
MQLYIALAHLPRLTRLANAAGTAVSQSAYGTVFLAGSNWSAVVVMHMFVLLAAPQYGAGICFQARSNVPESTTDGNPEATKQSVLKLSGNPWLKDNKAEVRTAS